MAVKKRIKLLWDLNQTFKKELKKNNYSVMIKKNNYSKKNKYSLSKFMQQKIESTLTIKKMNLQKK